MPKKLLFISGANLTVNPRLLKELKFAVKLGYEVDFIGFNSGNWSDEIDKELIKNIAANFHYIPITRKPFLKWFVNSIIEKIAKKLSPFLKNSFKINAYAHSKRSILLNNYLQKNKRKYNLIIAHTLATLYPAYKYSRKNKTIFTFDIEDYHPGEATADKKEIERRKFLMQKLLPKASYITYASPLIGEFTLKLFNSELKTQNSKLINNCFSQTEFQFKENNSEKVKFVWFSQNISQGRGLELIMPALYKFKEKVELHLIGNLYSEFYEKYLSAYKDIVTIHKPLVQKELNLKLSKFDVGLAIELDTADFNRQICLTNKIWAYLQSGLYILATDTPAQVRFLEEHKDCGQITKQNSDAFSDKIADINQNISKIRQSKQERFENAKQFSWENESEKLTEIWHIILK